LLGLSIATESGSVGHDAVLAAVEDVSTVNWLLLFDVGASLEIVVVWGAVPARSANTPTPVACAVECCRVALAVPILTAAEGPELLASEEVSVAVAATSTDDGVEAEKDLQTSM
jgi:hypothetical protein